MASDLNPASAEALTENAKLNKVSDSYNPALSIGSRLTSLDATNRSTRLFEQQTKMPEILFELPFFPFGTLPSLPTSLLCQPKNEIDETVKLADSFPRSLQLLLLLNRKLHRKLHRLLIPVHDD